MSFLPIVERELRVASRRRGTFLLRMFLVLVAMVIWFFLLSQGHASEARRGQVLFIAVGVLALGFSLLSGILLTADCLSEEKRQGTLGLLFLTDLKGYDVVLGKLVANSLHAFYGLLGILPLLALPLLMGGVTVGEFWRVTIALVTALSLSLTLGMAVSAFNQDTRQALSGSILLLILFTGMFPVLWMGFRYIGGALGWERLLWPSPVFLYTQAFDSNFSGSFYGSLITILSISVIALSLASYYLPRLWQEKSTAKPSRQRVDWSVLRFGNAGWRRLQRRFLEDNPYYWLASRERLPGRIAGLVMASCLPIWFCFLIGCFFPRRSTQGWCFGVVMFMLYGLHLVLKLMITSEACRRLNEDRRSGALELLLATPLSVQNIIDGQRRALSQTFRLPMLSLVAANCAALWVISVLNPLGMNDEAAIFSLFFLGGAVLLPVDYYALTRTGMRFALRGTKQTRAIVATLLRVMVPPWLIFILPFLASAGSRGMNSSEIAGFFLFWALTSGVLDLMVAAWAEANLTFELRRIASGSMEVVRRIELPTTPVLFEAEEAG